MSLYEEMDEYVKKNFGEFSADKIKEFNKEINAADKPNEFLEKCVSFIGTIYGEEGAKKSLQPFFDKYA